MRKEIDIFGGYNKSHVVEGDSRELMNLYVSESSNGMALYNTPGLSISNGIKIIADGGIRRLFVDRINSIMHVVVGNVLYQIDKSLNHSKGLDINTDNGFVGITENDYQALFVDGVSGYIYDKQTNIYSEIVDSNFIRSPADCTYLAERFITYKKDTNEWYYSGINDSTDWDLNYRYLLTSYSDIIQSVNVLHGRLYVFGSKCTEVWVPTVLGENPFARSETSLIEFGCVSRGTIAKDENVMVWVAQGDKGITSVVATNGGIPYKISSPAINHKLQSFTNPEDASAFIYTMNGNTFYQINFTTDNESLLYNFNTKKWSTLTSESFNRHRANCHSFFVGKHYVGDYSMANIYHLSTDYSEDEIEETEIYAIRRKLVTGRNYFNEGSGFCTDKLRLIAKQGQGTASGQDSMPYIECSTSHDGGSSYGDTLSSKLGPIGRREWKTDFYRFGTMDSIVIKLEFYNKIKFAIFKLIAYVSGFEE